MKNCLHIKEILFNLPNTLFFLMTNNLFDTKRSTVEKKISIAMGLKSLKIFLILFLPLCSLTKRTNSLEGFSFQVDRVYILMLGCARGLQMYMYLRCLICVLFLSEFADHSLSLRLTCFDDFSCILFHGTSLGLHK